jgi:hypothetical protein
MERVEGVTGEERWSQKLAIMEQLKFDGLVYYVFEPGAWKYIGQYA